MTDNRHNSYLGIGLVILATLAFAMMDGIGRFLVATYPIGQLLWIRYLVFSLFALWLCRSDLRQRIRTQRPWMQILRGAILLVEAFLFVASFRYLPLAETHAIASSTPLIVIVLAPIFLKEHVSLEQWLAVLIGFVGTLIIIRPGFAASSWVVVLPLLAAVLFATIQIMARLLGRTDQGTTTLLYSAMVGLVIISSIGPFCWSPVQVRDLALMVVIGLLAATGHYLLILALRHTPASVLQPYTYCLLVWAVAVGFVAFGDIPDAWTLSGGAIVVGSGLYCFHRERSPKTATHPPRTTNT